MSQRDARGEIAHLDLNSGPVLDMIADLVAHNVAITSTLAVFEAFDGSRPPLEKRFIDAVSPEAALSYLQSRATARGGPNAPAFEELKKEMDFEYAFVKAGGLLMAGADPTGNGGALAGFADQRNIELLVEAGFSPVQAIQIATSNGAKFLGELDRVGTIAAGKQARPGGDRRESCYEYRGDSQGEVGFQGWRGVRSGEAAGFGEGRGGDALRDRRGPK